MRYYRISTLDHSGTDGHHKYMFPSVDCPSCGKWGIMEPLDKGVVHTAEEGELFHAMNSVEYLSPSDYRTVIDNFRSNNSSGSQINFGMPDIAGRFLYPMHLISVGQYSFYKFVTGVVMRNEIKRDLLASGLFQSEDFIAVDGVLTDSWSELKIHSNCQVELLGKSITNGCATCGKPERYKGRLSSKIIKSSISGNSPHAMRIQNTLVLVASEQFIRVLMNRCSGSGYTCVESTAPLNSKDLQILQDKLNVSATLMERK